MHIIKTPPDKSPFTNTTTVTCKDHIIKSTSPGLDPLRVLCTLEFDYDPGHSCSHATQLTRSHFTTYNSLKLPLYTMLLFIRLLSIATTKAVGYINTNMKIELDTNIRFINTTIRKTNKTPKNYT